jgi:hypothetical protein
MLGGWQGTFCAGISTHNIGVHVRGVDYVVNVRSFAILFNCFVTDCSSRENTFERTALIVFTRKKCVQSDECYFKVRALKVMVLTVQLSVCCIGK